jgi:hypothetical protein
MENTTEEIRRLQTPAMSINKKALDLHDRKDKNRLNENKKIFSELKSKWYMQANDHVSAQAPCVPLNLTERPLSSAIQKNLNSSNDRKSFAFRP